MRNTPLPRSYLHELSLELRASASEAWPSGETPVCLGRQPPRGQLRAHWGSCRPRRGFARFEVSPRVRRQRARSAGFSRPRSPAQPGSTSKATPAFLSILPTSPLSCTPTPLTSGTMGPLCSWEKKIITCEAGASVSFLGSNYCVVNAQAVFVSSLFSDFTVRLPDTGPEPRVGPGQRVLF